MCTRKHWTGFMDLVCSCSGNSWTGNGDPMTHPHIFICIVFTGRDLRYQAGIFPRSEIRASDNLNVCYTQTFQHRTTGADCSYITVIPPYLRVNKAQVQPNTVTLRYCSISEVLAHRLPAFAFGMLITVAAPPPSLPPVQVFVIHDHSLWRWLPCWRSADSHKLAHQFYCHLSLNALQIEFFCCLVCVWPVLCQKWHPWMRHPTCISSCFCTSWLVLDVFWVCQADMFQIVDSFLCRLNTTRTDAFHCSTFVTLSLHASTQICCDTHNMANVSPHKRMHMILLCAIIVLWSYNHKPEVPPPSLCSYRENSCSWSKQEGSVCVCVLVWHIWGKRRDVVLADMGWVRACSCCALSHWGFFHIPAFHRLFDAPASC